MERIDHEGQIATAMTLSRMLNAIPLSASGPTRLIIYDIHALQERFYFDNHVLPLLLSAIPAFKQVLQEYHDEEDIVIAFPDEGARKRFGDKFPEYSNIITCTKIRKGNQRIVDVKEGEPEGKHVFIVDDLVKTGGTLLQCKNRIFELGATKVSAFVTHPVFPQESFRRFSE
eukprot:TRINITY_DN3054_c0_g1_i2.p1 TRINITY_DN3054_c0_g1~~TRINITY_DN3054_c0_g1_i2.p1  ORF type:complete len:172 (-),score=30.76 TRINITY_DN3054_c0_g1_i2:246-761(-)